MLSRSQVVQNRSMACAGHHPGGGDLQSFASDRRCDEAPHGPATRSGWIRIQTKKLRCLLFAVCPRSVWILDRFVETQTQSAPSSVRRAAPSVFVREDVSVEALR